MENQNELVWVACQMIVVIGGLYLALRYWYKEIHKKE